MADLVFIGKENGEYGEEMYINLSDEKLSGWSFMGLRPETEDKLIEQARDTEPEDMGLEKSQYFDMEAFRDDMESDAIERHDSQGEYERDGETYYLGFGSGQDIFGYFDKNGINEFDDFTSHFDEYNISEDQFYELKAILATYKEDEEKGYELFKEWADELPEFPSYVD